eukprot:2566737-Prymnesium_polylepis.2
MLPQLVGEAAVRRRAAGSASPARTRRASTGARAESTNSASPYCCAPREGRAGWPGQPHVAAIARIAASGAVGGGCSVGEGAGRDDRRRCRSVGMIADHVAAQNTHTHANNSVGNCGNFLILPDTQEGT